MVEIPPRTWRGLKFASSVLSQAKKHLHARGEDKDKRARSIIDDETPPRTWRGLKTYCLVYLRHRNTSTHVERTIGAIGGIGGIGKHLHARGEDFDLDGAKRFTVRNTSTHVERTTRGRIKITLREKHLHARGEDEGLKMTRMCTSETPPRTWRGPRKVVHQSPPNGNTSTHVERTSNAGALMPLCRKHLHARGEDFFLKILRRIPTETPPRTWRGLIQIREATNGARNTSTHVERTNLEP